ncbi:zinc finger protein 599-like [Clinocottus analis]|uniref:zinc finger protein 599-like n=1 Tax=Clinocottus analis TaxID=304258 RepID=UPI0035BF6F68
MSKVQLLSSFINQRLTVAAQEIFGLFERTIVEYEEELSRSKEENERQRRLLDAVFNQAVRIQRADVQHLLLVKEEVPPEQQDWSFRQEQEDPEPLHIKEEQEELWTSQEGEQLQGVAEAGIKFSFTPVKSEDDEEEAQSSQLHQRQTEQMETEADGAYCRGSEPHRKLDPERHPGPDTDETEYSSKAETDDSRDWKETQEPRSDSNRLQNNKVPESDVNCSTGNTSINLPECAGSTKHKRYLKIYTNSKLGAPVFSCSVCSKTLSRKADLNRHMTSHTGEKLFSCSVCRKRFSQKRHLNRHLTIHTGEKPFSCSVCRKTFSQKRNLKRHITTHTEVKAFCCSVKTFTQTQTIQQQFKSPY